VQSLDKGTQARLPVERTQARLDAHLHQRGITLFDRALECSQRSVDLPYSGIRDGEVVGRHEAMRILTRDLLDEPLRVANSC
jgi:hypothetical protein